MTVCAASIALLAGCAGPEQKLGRGLNNMTEFTRGGDITRSIEQTALWEGPTVSYTTGVIRGFDRSVVRTLTGVYEVITFPIPSYEPLFTNYMSVNPSFPDSYHPNIYADSIFGTDDNLGFTGGDIMPFIPGSRFRVFDY